MRPLKLIPAIILCLSLSSSAIAKTDNVILRFAHGGTTEHPYHIGAVRFADLVNELSDGHIVVKVFANGELGSEGEAAEAVRLGIVDLAVVSAGGIMPHWVPEMQVLDMPYLFRSRSHAYKVLDGEIGKSFAHSMSKYGFKNMGYWEIGIRHLTNNVNPVASVSDLANLKVRVMAANVYMELIKSFGAEPIPIPFTKLYSELQQGVVDGQENPITTIRSMGLYRVQKYLSLTAHTYSSAVVIMNKERYESLPLQYRRILDVVAENVVSYQREYVRNKEKEDLDYLRRSGVVVVSPNINEFKAASRVVYRTLEDDVPQKLIERIRAVR